MENQYETPEVTELGSLSDLTLQGSPQFAGPTDGFLFQGVNVGRPS